MMRKLVILVLSLALVLGVGLTACAPDEEPDEETIEIGALYPVSGELALLGEESFRGFELAVDYWNEQEGGINGVEVEINHADIPDAEAATAETERLITDQGLETLVGSYASFLSMAGTEVAERYGALYFELGAISDPIIADRDFEWAFRHCPVGSDFGVYSVEYIAEFAPDVLDKDLEDITIAFTYEDGPYGTSVGEYGADRAEELGMEVVAMEPYSSDAVDLSPVIERLNAADPDILSMTSYIDDAILFAEQAQDAGLHAPIMMGNGGGHSMMDFIDAIGEDALGLMNVDFTHYQVNHENAPGNAEFVEMYREKYDESPRSGHSLMNFGGGLVLLEAVEMAGTTEAEAVREALLEIEVEPFTTPVGFGASWDLPNAENDRAWPTMMQWQELDDGEIAQVAVSPEELAVVDEPDLPMPDWSE